MKATIEIDYDMKGKGELDVLAFFEELAYMIHAMHRIGATAKKPLRDRGADGQEITTATIQITGE